MTSETAMRQAAHTAEYYKGRAEESVLNGYPEEVRHDEHLRREVLDANKEVITVFMTVAAMDYQANSKFVE